MPKHVTETISAASLTSSQISLVDGFTMVSGGRVSLTVSPEYVGATGSRPLSYEQIGSTIVVAGHDVYNAIPNYWRSTDNGATWTIFELADAQSAQSAITVSGSTFVVVMMTGSSANIVLTSADGITWASSSAPELDNLFIQTIACSGSTICGLANYTADSTLRSIKSTNGGATWTTGTIAATAPNPSRIIFSGSRTNFIAQQTNINDQKFFSSSDGLTYTSNSLSILTSGERVTSLTTSGSHFLIGGFSLPWDYSFIYATQDQGSTSTFSKTFTSSNEFTERNSIFVSGSEILFIVFDNNTGPVLRICSSSNPTIGPWITYNTIDIVQTQPEYAIDPSLIHVIAASSVNSEYTAVCYAGGGYPCVIKLTDDKSRWVVDPISFPTLRSKTYGFSADSAWTNLQDYHQASTHGFSGDAYFTRTFASKCSADYVHTLSAEIKGRSSGLILQAPDGSRWEYKIIDNNGTLSGTKL